MSGSEVYETLPELLRRRRSAAPRAVLMTGLQLDLACAVARLEQAEREPGMREFLLYRLITCDLPRLRAHLDDEAQLMLARLTEKRDTPAEDNPPGQEEGEDAR